MVNATFGSITEMTFYITALLRGHRAATKCYEEIVKAALTGTLLGCILFIPVSASLCVHASERASRWALSARRARANFASAPLRRESA